MGGADLEILYNKEICHLQLKNVDLYVCPASFIINCRAWQSYFFDWVVTDALLSKFDWVVTGALL